MHINWEYLTILFDYNYQFLSVEAGKSRLYHIACNFVLPVENLLYLVFVYVK